jgi:hypothetical protein
MPIIEAPYYVWRRDDGYVGCTRYDPKKMSSSSTFELLLQTDVWEEAKARLRDERKDPRHQQAVASWEK